MRFAELGPVEGGINTIKLRTDADQSFRNFCCLVAVNLSKLRNEEIGFMAWNTLLFHQGRTVVFVPWNQYLLRSIRPLLLLSFSRLKFDVIDLRIVVVAAVVLVEFVVYCTNFAPAELLWERPQSGSMDEGPRIDTIG